ncbi:MAG TPA: kelch repeat-containing protein [Thermoanaerobaculia bacterium]|nr:kelch repeat-containing protein [Thermoanaerobaculia bacterium]
MRNPKTSVLLVVMLSVTLVSGPRCRASVGTEKETRPAKAGSGGVVRAIRDMTTKRAAHTATLLNDGTVLIAGGFAGNSGGLSSAEVFDPKTNSFTSVKSMSAARSGHTATSLPGGRVLIAGGYNGDYLDSAELYDPASGRSTSAGMMITGRSGHVATLLDNGKVLLAGGVGKGWTFLSDAEIYDPATNTFTATGAMSTERESHTATLLKDGTVLITGGHKGRRSAITIYTSAEIYSPARGTFTATSNLTVKRHKHDATLLADGRVLIVGGSDERDGDGAYRNVEMFNPAGGTFTAVRSSMKASRYKLQGTAILLESGKVLIAGGADRAEVFDPANSSFSFADGDMGTRRLFSTATLLKNGRVLITGGCHDGNSVSANAWMYRS